MVKKFQDFNLLKNNYNDQLGLDHDAQLGVPQQQALTIKWKE